MNRIISVLLVVILLCGCDSNENCMLRGMDLREKLLGQSCSFVAQVTADYGDRTYTFRVGCTADSNGDVSFIVIAPESISGIGGTIKADSGFLTFEDAVLAFPLLADGEVSPVSAPWLIIKSLRSGYLSSAGLDGELLQLILNDSYESDALQVDVWLNEDDLPKQADILWQGRRVLSVEIEDFAFV